MNRSHFDVVIVGAGFAGLQVVKNLRNSDLNILLIDRHNYHTFQPLLYQVATAGLGPEHVAHSIRDIFQSQNNFDFLMDTVTGVNFDQNNLILEKKSDIHYEYLILAAGASPNYFGIPGAKEHSVPMKNLSNAVHLRSHILERFEIAQEDPDRIDDGILNFIVVGGGPTGIETAGALVELFDHVLTLDFSEKLVNEARVILVEMLPHLLAPYDESLRDYTQKELQRRGVEVKTETTVDRVTENTVHFQDNNPINTETLIWAAGVKANPLADQLDIEQGQGGRILVDSDLTLPNQSKVFAIGDIAGAVNDSGDLLPQLAPVAIQQGEYAAETIKKNGTSDKVEDFVYDDPGQMATIGRHAAVVQLANGLKFTGYFAWLVWVLLHIAKLIGFRNKLMVFLSWIYNYLTYGSSSRLILGIDPEEDYIEETNPGAN